MPDDAKSVKPIRSFVIAGLFLVTWTIPLTGSELLRGLWPSILALTTVILVKRVISGLLLGALAGAILLEGGNPVAAAGSLVGEHLLPSFSSSWKLGALAFTLLLGGFAGLVERVGGLETLISRFLDRRSGYPPRRFQGSTMGLGLICFFDGLANAILLGRVTRTMADRCGVSRVKMAYIVDSTASTVACLAFISTWIAFQLSLIESGLADLGKPGNPYVLFFQSIPLNFYCLFTLALLLVVIVSDFHIGPMRGLEAEARGRLGEKGTAKLERAAPAASALVPLFTLVVAIMASFCVFHWIEQGGTIEWTWRTPAIAFSTGYGAEAMVIGSLIGIAAAWISFKIHRKGGAAHHVFLEGVRALVIPVLILVAAWILGSTIDALGTAELIAETLAGKMSYGALAGLVFVTGAVISFSTGTSWGTMGILMPLAIPAVFLLGDASGHSEPEQYRMLSLCIAAVFSGAVFGDHCSPFSDTTIVSSIACDVEPHDHVRTQIPFALLAAAVALVAGFLPAGYGMPGIVSLGAGLAAIALLPLVFRKQRIPRVKVTAAEMEG